MINENPTPLERYFSNIEFTSRIQQKITPDMLNRVEYDGGELWFWDYPVGGYNPITDESPGAEMLILEAMGKRDGLKLTHPTPRETMEIMLSEKGINFINNVLLTRVPASILATRNNRINNGIIVERKIGGDYIARELTGVKIEERKVTSEILLFNKDGSVSSTSFEEGVREVFNTGNEQKISKQPGHSYFKRKFDGMLPSEGVSYSVLRDMEKEELGKYAGVWTFYDQDDQNFSRENLAIISSYFADVRPCGLSVFPLRARPPVSRDTFLSTIPIFTREHPKQ